MSFVNIPRAVSLLRVRRVNIGSCCTQGINSNQQGHTNASSRPLLTSAVTLFPHSHIQRANKLPCQPPQPISRQPIRLLQMKPGNTRTFKPKYKSDRVSPDYTLVYQSNLTTYIQLMYLTVGVVGVSTSALVAFRWQELATSLGTKDGMLFGIISTGVAISLGWVFYIARAIPMRIYHNSNTGHFVSVRRNCFGQLKQLGYYTADVSLDDSKTQKELHQAADLVIKGHDCYLIAEDFVSPMYYSAHLGCDDGPKNPGDSFVGGPKF